jgi:hypothetical protein
MDAFTFLVEAILLLGVVVAPVALMLLIMSVAVAQVIGDLVLVTPGPLERGAADEEDPAPRWRPGPRRWTTPAGPEPAPGPRTATPTDGRDR